MPHRLALLRWLAKSHRSRVDTYDLARLNGIDVRQAGGDMDQQVFEAVGGGTKNENGDGSASKILLVFDALIHGNENIEVGNFSGGKKIAILKSGEPSVTSSLAIVAGKGVAETLVDAFVDKNAHLGTREQQVFRFFEGGQSRFAGDGGEPLQKCFECFSAFEVVEERLDRHSGAPEHGGSAENLRVFYDDLHGRIVPRGTRAAREEERIAATQARPKRGTIYRVPTARMGALMIQGLVESAVMWPEER